MEKANKDLQQRPEEIENHLREKRSSHGLSQEKLAGMAGVTRQAICAIEAGHYSPATSVALRLAQALHCRVEDLFSLSGTGATLEGDCIGSVPELSSRVKVLRVGNRTVIQPLASLGGFVTFTEPADGLLVDRSPQDRRAKVRLLRDLAMVERQIAIAGCNPAMFLAGEYLRRHPNEGGLVVWMTGSESALAALKRGEVHVAGLHILDERSGESNLPYLRRHLKDREYLVATFAAWEEGLIVARGNPKRIRRIDDLGHKGVRLVNREGGSGARRLLDRKLAAIGLRPQQLQGYGLTVGSHLEVAWCIKEGLADAGIGVHAAAAVFGLDFIPLQEERYDLVIPKAYLDIHPALKIFLDTIVSRPFRAEVEALGGYDTRDTGKVLDLTAA
jgi:molybdate-binding protein/DNA-binding XRE family transcriptional regulator